MASECRSKCPIANALDLLGDRWTLVVIRDLFIGKRTYKEFLESPEGIATNILAERLRRLEASGLVERRQYRARPARYSYALTEKGADLLPTLQALCRWANRYIAETWQPPASFMTASPADLLQRLAELPPLAPEEDR